MRETAVCAKRGKLGKPVKDRCARKKTLSIHRFFSKKRYLR